MEASLISWKKKATEGRSCLTEARRLQNFLEDVDRKDIQVRTVLRKMASDERPTSVEEAKRLVQEHEEVYTEVEEFKQEEEMFKVLREKGKTFAREHADRKEEICVALERLEDTKQTVRPLWDREKKRRGQLYSLLVFEQQVKTIEDWIMSKKAILNEDEFGLGMESVDLLLRNHETFNQTVKAYSENIDLLKKDADNLWASQKDPEISIEVCKRKRNVKLRYEQLVQDCQNHSKELQDTVKFMKTRDELKKWFNENIQIASSPCPPCLDPAGFQLKLQQHRAFESSVWKNQGLIEAVKKEWKQRIVRGHFAKDQIETQLEEMAQSWDTLVRISKEKSDRLQEALDAYKVSKRLEGIKKDVVSLDKWLRENEGCLEQGTAGSVAALNEKIHKYDDFLTTLQAQEEKLEALKTLSFLDQAASSDKR